MARTKKQKEVISKRIDRDTLGSESLRQAMKTNDNFEKILRRATNPKEFKKIWDAVPATNKLYFIQQNAKFISKEKGKEEAVPPEDKSTKTIELMAEVMAKMAEMTNKK